MDSEEVFVHNYTQLADMLSEYVSTMGAVNQLSLQYLHGKQVVLKEIVDSAYHAYSAMHSLVKALAAAGSESAEGVLAGSRDFSNKVESGWRELKSIFSGNMPNLDHPLLALDFVVREEEEEEEEGEKDGEG